MGVKNKSYVPLCNNLKDVGSVCIHIRSSRSRQTGAYIFAMIEISIGCLFLDVVSAFPSGQFIADLSHICLKFDGYYTHDCFVFDVGLICGPDSTDRDE